MSNSKNRQNLLRALRRLGAVYFDKRIFRIANAAIFLTFFFAVGLTLFTQQNKIGDLRDGSRSVPVHLIKLYDADSVLVLKNDNPVLPFSTKYTCGECHSYEIINKGFHFNAYDRKVKPGRKGEPWIYVDWRNLTVIPVSERKLKGTHTPSSLGISSFKFLDLFGSHFPGGGIGEIDSLQNPADFFRWEVSGKLDVNCLACHDANPEYDPAEFSAQMQKQNFKWAAAAASAISEVSGNASKMPDNFDVYNHSTYADIDRRTTAPPTIDYDKVKFNSNNQIFFDISRKAKKERCYYCHSSVTYQANNFNQWDEDEDVHLQKGITCADCHRNGIDHDMIRGYRDEAADKSNFRAASFSCVGCHIKNGDAKPGKGGAPVPLHKGIPQIHFEKLECTVCHSGTLPEGRTSLTKTSRAHKLGIRKSNKQGDLFPHIQSPVYVRNEKGMIEPNYLIWPSYWAKKIENKITPLSLSEIDNAVAGRIKLDTLLNYGKWHTISDSMIISVLKKLNQNSEKDNSSFVYITGGIVIELEKNKLRKSEHESASAYSWPKAHSVRPASQALGANGCDDCHSTNSNFLYGKVNVVSSLKSQKDSLITMTKFLDLNTVYQKVFSFSFFFRPWLKGIIIISFVLVLFVFLIYSAKAILAITRTVTKDKV
ncbi:MAG: signal peptide protein [Ignavibacteria bacterium]|nr:MAG: signal peptide protein [Ignavibacteria bacterium]KAF0161784.1 MAG: signal peptide protein [Ignavibacteria bacterium]